MSLLMDALKRAEQEKKDAARKVAAEEETPVVPRKEGIKEGVPEFTDEYPVFNTDSYPIVVEQATESSADKTHHTPSMDLALEPLESGVHNPLIPRRPAALIMDTTDPDATLNVYSDKLSLKPDPSAPDNNAVDADSTQQVQLSTLSMDADPDQTFNNVKLDTAAIPGLYEDTMQGEPFRPVDLNNSYEETLPGVPAAQLARDIGTQDQPTPVAAQTLFSATNTITKPSSGFKWLMISLGVLAVGSALVFYYYTVTPVSRNIPSPMVARGVETIIPSQNLQLEGTAPVPAPATTEPATVATAVPGTPPVSTAEPAATASVAETPVVAQTETSAPVVAAATETPAVSVQPEPTLPREITPPASLIRISRTPSSTVQGDVLGEAFAAYQQGNYELAGQKYRQASEQLPDNRDVMLGLAAVASKTGDKERALQLYMRLVALNPLDNVARAALISLHPGEDISVSISTVKSMIADSPEQASLYFTLGKLYAAQANWAGAQQAFFDAYRLDSANPDYAFNLAVSLDRLEQGQSALDYYTVAQGLAESSPASFNRTAVADRINTLEAGN
jgi:Flp pilus assembly protein TadD